VTITIESNGDLTFLNLDSCQPFKTLGTVTTKRASHVEPYDFWPRLAFTVIRMLVSDSSGLAEWTRRWAVDWRVNTKPVGGPILTWDDVCETDVPYPMVIYRWRSRKAAIAAEIKFLDQFFAER
jgi:hypothetical protein